MMPRSAAFFAVLVVLAGVGQARATIYTIDFSGRIDGSDVIRVDADRATWTHKFWSWPGAVAFNGTNWQPGTNRQLVFAGGPLIPANLADYSVSLNRTRGRDEAVAELKEDHLLIHLADAPPGSDTYEFQVVLTPKPPPTVTPAATLRIQGRIDGSDRIRLTDTAATWVHRYWATPSSMSLGAVAWNPGAQPVLPNSGATRFLPAGVDLTTAMLTNHGGRDMASLEIFADRTEIVFVDTPNGSDIYDVTVTFGSVPEPSTLVLLGIGAVVLAAYARRRKHQR